MALPALYRYGQEGKWFGPKLFSVFMVEGVVQVSRASYSQFTNVTRFASQSAIIYFILVYAYFSPSTRNDGYSVAQVEFSTTMVIAAATAANLFNGLCTKFWTAWVFFAVFIGIVLVWAYTVRLSLLIYFRPGSFLRTVPGNLLAHLPRVVRHVRLWKRPLPVQIPYLLFRLPDHGHTRATPEVPLHGVDVRLQPQRLGHPELELQTQTKHGHNSRSRVVPRTGGGGSRTGPHDPAQHNVPWSYGTSVDTGQPDRHVHGRAFAVARIQLCARGKQCGYAPHSEQSVGRFALRVNTGA
jgi:hypothetical protein